MFEFFAALFGGAYYGAKIASDRANSKIYDKKVDAWRSAFEAWQAEVVDKDLETEIEAFAKNLLEEDAVVREVERLCPVLPDDQKRPDNYTRVLLAAKGKIRAIDAVGGIRTPVYYVGGAARLENLPKRMQFNAYMRWLDNELRNNGIVQRMVFIPMDTPDVRDKEYYELSEVDEVEALMGTFQWMPQRLRMSL